MLIYNYDETTKEYLNYEEAEADPAETEKQGHFVPLVPANATLTEVIEEKAGKARVFNSNAWAYVDDYRGKYKINSSLVFEEITKLYEDVEGYDIKTKTEKEAIEEEGLSKYKFENNKLIHKTEEELADERQADFESKFLTLDTNKNYRLQPKGYANAQQSIDTVNNMVNVAGSLTEQIATMILFYETPDFSDETQCTEEWLIQHQYSAEPMTLAEWQAFYVDFTTKYAQKMYQQQLLEQGE